MLFGSSSSVTSYRFASFYLPIPRILRLILRYEKNKSMYKSAAAAAVKNNNSVMRVSCAADWETLSNNQETYLSRVMQCSLKKPPAALDDLTTYAELHVIGDSDVTKYMQTSVCPQTFGQLCTYVRMHVASYLRHFGWLNVCDICEPYRWVSCVCFPIPTASARWDYKKEEDSR